ncbi:hypothetical protein PAXINDRAFT_17843 [Paxillus involutus ATCC 200175]|uniref:Uncharacterized protein n=1 Tax=Paxillus involutus ATCC 200175 TaxID=664439 RepID=A0A0C9T0B9_PAXIN|nr:hypothetical protein PAXINDRAFT_17843 [Paxillus involutus ATCC 200175]
MRGHEDLTRSCYVDSGPWSRHSEDASKLAGPRSTIHPQVLKAGTSTQHHYRNAIRYLYFCCELGPPVVCGEMDNMCPLDQHTLAWTERNFFLAVLANTATQAGQAFYKDTASASDLLSDTSSGTFPSTSSNSKVIGQAMPFLSTFVGMHRLSPQSFKPNLS